jgi:hypothetical protein
MTIIDPPNAFAEPPDRSFYGTVTRWVRSNFTKMLLRVAAVAFTAGITASFGVWTTWQGLQQTVATVKADQARTDRSVGILRIDVDLIRARLAADEILRAKERADAANVARDVDRIIDDLKFMQRELIGRVRRPNEN